MTVSAEGLTMTVVATDADRAAYRALLAAESPGYNPPAAADPPASAPMLLRLRKEPVGTLCIDYVNPSRAMLSAVAIRRALRRQGLGTRMVRSALAAAKSRGCVEAVVIAGGDAVEFFRHLGFRQDFEPDPYADPATQGDVQMTIVLAGAPSAATTRKA